MTIRENGNYLAFDEDELIYFSGEGIYSMTGELRETFQRLLEPEWFFTGSSETFVNWKIHFFDNQFRELRRNNFVLVFAKRFLNDLWENMGSLTGIQKFSNGKEVVWVRNNWQEANGIMNKSVEIMTDEEYNQAIANYNYNNPLFEEYKKFYKYLFVNNLGEYIYGKHCKKNPALFQRIWDEVEKKVCDIDPSKKGYVRPISQGPWKGEKINSETEPLKKWPLKNMCDKYIIRGGNEVILKKQKEILSWMKELIGKEEIPSNPRLKFKNLKLIRNNAIQEINQALSEKPKLDNSNLDLSNRNWLNKINEAKEESAINIIKNLVINNVKWLRRNLQISIELDQLIFLAQQTNNYEKLSSFIQQIAQFEGEEAFIIRKKEIDNLRNKLSQLNPHKYRENAFRQINNKIKDNKLEGENLPKNLREKIRKIKNEKLGNSQFSILREEILREVNLLKSEKDLQNIIQEIQQAKTAEEKQAIREKLTQFKNGDWYQKTTYEKMEEEINKYLSQWNNSDSFGKNEPPSQVPWKIIISLFFVCTLISAWIIIFLYKRPKKRKIVKVWKKTSLSTKGR